MLNKIKNLLFLLPIVPATLFLSSCSQDVHGDKLIFEKEINGSLKKVSVSDFGNESYYNTLLTLVIRNETNVLDKFLSSESDSESKLIQFNKELSKKISENNNQKLLKIYFAQSIFFLFNDIYYPWWTPAANGGNGDGNPIKTQEIINFSKVYSDLIVADNKDDVEEKQTFKNLDILVNDIENIEIKLIKNENFNSIEKQYIWTTSFTIKEDSKFLTVFQDENGNMKKNLIFKNSVNTWQDETQKQFKAMEAGPAKDAFEIYHSYQSTKHYWKNDERKLISIPLQSNFSFFSKIPTLGGFVAKGEKNIRKTFSLDFIQQSNKIDFRPVIKINTSEMFENISLREWKTYLKWKKINESENVFLDVGFDLIRFENFTK
ncbi:MAG: hypothetical protein ACRCRZ_00855 [Metamycoplasmataceae bacterium]